MGKDEADRRHVPMCVLITFLFLEKIIFCAFAIAMQRLIFQVFSMLFAVLTQNYIMTILQKQTFYFRRQVAPGSAENAAPRPCVLDSVPTQLWRQKRQLEKYSLWLILPLNLHFFVFFLLEGYRSRTYTGDNLFGTDYKYLPEPFP